MMTGVPSIGIAPSMKLLANNLIWVVRWSLTC